MWSKLISFVHALCSGKSKMDSVQRLPNASSVAVPCAKPIRTGLCPEGAYDAVSGTAWQNSR